MSPDTALTESFPTGTHRISTALPTILAGRVEILTHDRPAGSGGYAFHPRQNGVHAGSCPHRPGVAAATSSERHCANRRSATARDFHSFAERTYKCWLDCVLDRDFQHLHTGFPPFERQFSNTVVEIYARTAARPQPSWQSNRGFAPPVTAGCRERIPCAWLAELGIRGPLSPAGGAPWHQTSPS